MKRLLQLTAVLILIVAPALAQDPLEPPPGPPPGMDEPDMGQPPPPPEEMHGGQPPSVFVDRWLERLKEKDPEEYARLQKLKETNPEEFRKALFGKLVQERMRHRSEGGRHGRPPMNPEIQALQKETMEMSKAYSQATDEAAKKQLRTELRQKLEVLFDLREKERKEHIQRIEADLANLKKSLDERQQNREQIIERRLQELTEGDGLRW